MAHLGIPTPFRMKAKKGTVACTARTQAGENFSVCSLIAPKGTLAAMHWLPTPRSFTGRACGRSSFVVRSLATCCARDSGLKTGGYDEMSHLTEPSSYGPVASWLQQAEQVWNLLQQACRHIVGKTFCKTPNAMFTCQNADRIRKKRTQRKESSPLLCLPR